MLRTEFGLFVFSFGEFLTILGNIGLTPWDTVTMGISYHVPLSFGQVHVLSALIIVIIDLAMGEKIGIGTILDAVSCGTFVDLFSAIVPYSGASNKWAGLMFMIVGLLIMAVGQVFYMSGGLSCGPRDSLMVAVGKRLPKIPIGYVDIIMKVVLVGIALLLRGPVGVGTVIAMFGMGLAMQIVYGLFKFDPRSIKQEGIVESCKHLLGKTE